MTVNVWGYRGSLVKSVALVADLLGEATGHCAECGRPVRLVTGEWPGPRYCIGGEQPPDEQVVSRG